MSGSIIVPESSNLTSLALPMLLDSRVSVNLSGSSIWRTISEDGLSTNTLPSECRHLGARCPNRHALSGASPRFQNLVVTCCAAHNNQSESSFERPDFGIRVLEHHHTLGLRMFYLKVITRNHASSCIYWFRRGCDVPW